MYRILDGVLYDTEQSEFIGSFSYNTYSSKYKKSSSVENYYIAKNGVMFCVYNNNITLELKPEKVQTVKERMNPKVYAKYWTLTVPGEGPMMSKEQKEVAKKKKLEDVE